MPGAAPQVRIDALTHPKDLRFRAPLYWAVFSVTVLVRGLWLSLGNRWAGFYGYDEGVYLTGAIRLSMGQLPYRDFTSLHPPGLLLALQPVAWVERLFGDQAALAAGRGLYVLLAGFSAVGVTWLARRLGRWPAIAAACVFVLALPELNADIQLRLEPVYCAALIWAMVCLYRLFEAGAKKARWALLAGALLGLACTVKLFALAPAVVVVGFVWLTRTRREARTVTVAALGTAVLVAGPFFVAAPGAMIGQVVTSQSSRGEAVTSRRLNAGPLAGLGRDGWTALVVVVAVLALVLVVRRIVQHRSAENVDGMLAQCWLAYAVASSAGLAVSPSYYQFYLVLLVLPAAMGAAYLVRAVVRLRGDLLKVGWTNARRFGLVVCAVALLGWFGVVNPIVPSAVAHTFRGRLTVGPGPTSTLARQLLARGDGDGCAVAATPDELIATGLLKQNLARGCAAPTDYIGMRYLADAGVAIPEDRRLKTPVEVERWVNHLARGSSLVVVHSKFSADHYLRVFLLTHDEAHPVGQAGALQFWYVDKGA